MVDNPKTRNIGEKDIGVCNCVNNPFRNNSSKGKKFSNRILFLKLKDTDKNLLYKIIIIQTILS